MKKLLIILLFPVFVNAQTKLYLNLTAVPGNTPAVNAAWNVTTGNVVRMALPGKDGSTIASTTSGNTGAAAVRKILIKQYITQPLAAQTFTSKTLTGQIRFNMSSVSSRTGEGFVYFRILNPNGTVKTEVGTLTTSALTTTLTNRTLITLTFTQTILAGERFCFDIGWNYSTGSNTATNAVASFGSSSATDLAVDNTTTTANNPFVQFNQTVVFQKPYKHFF